MRLPTTIGLIFLLVLLWLLGALFSPPDEPAGILAMSIGDVILKHIRPWVYVTSGFYHPHLVQLVLVLPVALGLAKRVEPELGSLNLVRLLAFVNVLASFVLFIDLFGLYIVFRQPVFLSASLSGFSGGITALLVAFMKPNPHATAPMFPGVKLRYYPVLASVFFSVCSLVGVTSTTVPIRVSLIGAGPYSILGGYLGWYYLRFLNKNPDKTTGDVSEDFALAILLPDVCEPLVSPVGNFCFNVVRLCGYFKGRAAKAPTTLPIVTESTDPIAERRKARAMKALDEKLAKLANVQHGGKTEESTVDSSAIPPC